MVENTEGLTFASLLAEGIRRIKKSKAAISKELRGALGPDPVPWVRYERIAAPAQRLTWYLRAQALLSVQKTCPSENLYDMTPWQN